MIPRVKFKLSDIWVKIFYNNSDTVRDIIVLVENKMILIIQAQKKLKAVCVEQMKVIRLWYRKKCEFCM